jgi:hypothetical protein
MANAMMLARKKRSFGCSKDDCSDELHVRRLYHMIKQALLATALLVLPAADSGVDTEPAPWLQPTGLNQLTSAPPGVYIDPVTGRVARVTLKAPEPLPEPEAYPEPYSEQPIPAEPEGNEAVGLK